jgi:hypothetical protein
MHRRIVRRLWSSRRDADRFGILLLLPHWDSLAIIDHLLVQHTVHQGPPESEPSLCHASLLGLSSQMAVLACGAPLGQTRPWCTAYAARRDR